MLPLCGKLVFCKSLKKRFNNDQIFDDLSIEYKDTNVIAIKLELDKEHSKNIKEALIFVGSEPNKYTKKNVGNVIPSKLIKNIKISREEKDVDRTNCIIPTKFRKSFGLYKKSLFQSLKTATDISKLTKTNKPKLKESRPNQTLSSDCKVKAVAVSCLINSIL